MNLIAVALVTSFGSDVSKEVMTLDAVSASVIVGRK